MTSSDNGPEFGKIAQAVSELRVSNGIVIVGAGASFEAGMPLAGQLAPMVWQTLDEHQDIRRAIADRLGVLDADAKRLIGDTWDRIVIAFEFIAGNRNNRQSFQQTFCRLDQTRRLQHSIAHDALSKLVHSGIVEVVVSLNWDTLLEAAFTERYGTNINASRVRVEKPHGDANVPGTEWVLPHQPGVISKELKERINSLVIDRPRSLIVVGYSERDEVVLDQLIRPLSNRWRVFRIGPTATGEGAIRLPAATALQELARELCPDPEAPGWSYLTFANQRGIAAAITGERLSPADVDCCPRLPQAIDAARNLSLLNYAVISGPSGCGKSITAYQVANDLRKAGREILRLDHPVESVEGVLRAAKHAATPNALLVDDGQLINDKLLQGIRELATPDTAVLITVTDRSAGEPNHIRISNDAAVRTLASDFLDRRDEIFDIVTKLDRDVGPRYGDTPIERRIESASEAETPWQFNFILRGGWRTAASELSALKEFERADLLLLLIAACQIATLDEAVDRPTLHRIAQIAGRDRGWVDSGIEILRQRGNLLRSDEIRCPHIRYAAIVVQCWFDDGKDPEFEAAVRMIQHLLTSSETPLRGISWLLDDLWMCEARRLRDFGGLIDTTVRDTLISRCLTATNSRQRKESLWVLGQLCRWGADHFREIASHSSLLANWLESVDDEYASAFASLLNWLWNFDRDKDEHSASATTILDASNPIKVAERVGLASPASGYGWGELLSHLFLHASLDWRGRFWTAVDQQRILKIADGFSGSQLHHLSRFIQGIAPFDEELTFAALDRSMAAIGDGLRSNPLDAWEDIDTELGWSVLGYSWFRRQEPDGRQKKYARRIVALFPVDRIGKDLSASRQRDWERFSRMLGWIQEVNRDVHRRIVEAVDFDQLNTMTKGLWKQPPRELRLLISCLTTQEDGEPSRSWVTQHEQEIEVVDPLTAIAAPDVAIRVFHRGGKIDLLGHNSDWGTAARALRRIKNLDLDVAKRVAVDTEERLIQTINKLEQNHCDDNDIILYLHVLKQLDAELPQAAVQKVDAALAQVSWKKRLGDRMLSSKRAVALLTSIGLRCDGPVAELSRELRARIPKRVAEEASVDKL